ncbi:MAG TPA: Ig-like domain-containing protein [Gemmatimonadaceae bacterium]|nr:Ig-like domain-containing protein [Gemmatimonadaceae bacterium]
MDGVTGITISPTNVTLEVGETGVFTASVATTGSAAKTATFSSSNTSVATIDATSGTVTAVAPGNTTITATATADADQKSSTQLTVVPVDVDVAAVVSIQSITTGALNTPVNVTNTFGQIDVSINLQPNDEVISTLDLLVDDVVVGSQTYSAALGAFSYTAGSAEAAADVIVLSFRTDAFDPATGVVSFLNGQHEIKAVANVTSSGTGTQRASNTQTLTFNNNDGFYATMTNTPKNGGIASAVSAGGIEWRQGDVEVTTVPVIYSPTAPNGDTPKSVCIRTVEFGVGPADSQTEGAVGACVSGPITSTLVLAQGAAGYQSAGLELPVVTGAVFSDGSAVVFNNNGAAPASTGGMINVGVQPAAGSILNGFRMDNLSPMVNTPDITRLSPAVTGWVNASFTFAALVANADAGVGLRSTSDLKGQYIGCDAADWTDFDGTGATIPECASNFLGGDPLVTPGPYTARAVESDRLNNVGQSVPTLEFGVDKTAPLHRWATVFVAPGQTMVLATDSLVTNVAAPGAPATNPTFSTEAIDDRAGFGPDGSQYALTLSRTAPNANGAANAGQCLTLDPDPIGPGAAFLTASTCPLAVGTIAATLLDGYRQSTLVDPIGDALAGVGYFSYMAQWYDAAGNASVDAADGAVGPLYRVSANDPVAPTNANVNVPTSITGAVLPQFSSVVTDDVEIIGQSFVLQYPEITANGPVLAYPRTDAFLTFDDVISGTGLISTSLPYAAPFVRHLEMADAVGAVQPAPAAPKPDVVLTTVFDVFGNFAASPASLIPALIVEDGANFDTLTTYDAANTTFVLGPVSAAFNAPAGLKAQAVGPLNSINAPFARVDFYRWDGVAFTWNYLGSSSSVINADNGVNRVWSYMAPATFANSPTTTTAQAAAAAGDDILAVGVLATGDGLATHVNSPLLP